MFLKSHNIDKIDYLTFHLWIENWKWYNPTKANETYENALKQSYEYININVKIAKELSKPIVLEELGIARDDRSYDPNSTTKYRDRFYTYILEKVYDISRKDKCLAGVNFWAWAGEGRPRQPGAIWKAGDDFIGNPPHEFQGWYSVYNIDNSTIKIISNYAKKMNSLT